MSGVLLRTCCCGGAFCTCPVLSYSVTMDVIWDSPTGPQLCGNSTFPISTIVQQQDTGNPLACLWDNRGQFGTSDPLVASCAADCSAPFIVMTAGGISATSVPPEHFEPESQVRFTAGWQWPFALDANGCPLSQSVPDQEDFFTDQFSCANLPFTPLNPHVTASNVSIAQISPGLGTGGGGRGLGDLIAQGINRVTLGRVRECDGCGRRRATLNRLGRRFGLA